MKRTYLLAWLVCIFAPSFSGQAHQPGERRADVSTDYLKKQRFSENQVDQLPALIPLPQKIEWAQEKFDLKNYTAIISNTQASKPGAVGLQRYLAEKNIRLPIKATAKSGERIIELWLHADVANQNNGEAYGLSVLENKITISSATPHGVFNAIRTLKQLTVGNQVHGCEINDSPAFSWRGFMVDVGRNFQSIKQLKQQIDVMAAYKLNIFHFHLTEDIAWRLQSKKYPQLTTAKNMLRNPGKYYALAEVKDLIQYCRDRYITLVPEIDMPGHSAAFTRAMGVNMQSEAGTKICKEILSELCTELDIPYVHIGGDEVKITNKDFLPQMIALLKSFNKKIIAWDPGGNVPEGTILQMWNGNTVPKKGFSSIDSRHLYLNHFDPIDGVVTTFNHQVCDVPTGDENNLGATLCNWPDRRVEKEEDLVNMNAVYPVMISFAERCWRGGGYKNYLSDVGEPGTNRYNEFVAFENRLLEHKSRYFKNLSFPYVRQSDIEWKLVGPFNNNGKTGAVFAPESALFFDTVQLKNFPSVWGGTIWLRHFWHPLIGSHLPDPPDSTTYYAVRQLLSDEAGMKDCWIGFNNLSRSYATDAPPVGAWDNRQSAVWVNGKMIPSPAWKRGGQKGDPEIPLIDEGYEYRAPTKVFFKKGWNTILIKAPVSSFTGTDWQNPVKWAFTFIPIAGGKDVRN